MLTTGHDMPLMYMQSAWRTRRLQPVHAVWSADLAAVQGGVQPPVHPKIPLSPHAAGAAVAAPAGAAAGALQGDVGTASGLGGLPAGGMVCCPAAAAATSLLLCCCWWCCCCSRSTPCACCCWEGHELLLAHCVPDRGLLTPLGPVADLNGWYGMREAAWDTYLVSSHQSGQPLAWNRSHCSRRAAEGGS
jgi:hypothetical protein